MTRGPGRHAGPAAPRGRRVRYVADEEKRFLAWFDPATGEYVRTGVLDPAGRDTGKEAFMASFPHLVDVGIMGHCMHGKLGICLDAGVQCYQDGVNIEQPNMPLFDFRQLARECAGRTFQFALGGRGDPDQHEDIEGILHACAESRIVPNYTTSGLGLDERAIKVCAEYCGAVAVSWYRREHTLAAIGALLDAGVKTNIHYVLGSNTIDEALHLLLHGGVPSGVNALVFLLHKPVGLGTRENVLRLGDERVTRFFAALSEPGRPYKVGVDSCSVPGVINFCSGVDFAELDTCEGARYSCYVTPDLQALPCSFDQGGRWSFDLRQGTLAEAWRSTQFDHFRARLTASCPGCPRRLDCMGGCPIVPEIVLCEREERHPAQP